jgi:hypothetical protein
MKLKFITATAVIAGSIITLRAAAYTPVMNKKIFIQRHAAGVYQSNKSKALAGMETDSSTAKKMTDRMQTQLTLDADQYNKVYAVNEQFLDAMAELKNSPGKKLGKFREMKSIDDDRDKQLKKILTSDQYNIYRKNKEANREKMREAHRSNQQ